ncbi:BRCT domain-containing protein At4g02110-like [Vicia villosa]|uniref:BRCT domain-containing protein At4g02110-like n=1 Tax=Vicia villosa TaxID=3911 RepID=UPI00273CF0EB|nr:BRCT domain-containing protein At4g02110-like [Vicia villosa]
MLENSHSPRVFRGVHFSLFGFDPLTESKIRFKLVNGGGIDAGRNSGNCTHVIVDNLVYDDPVCAAARDNGKTLVTSLWVEHSADIGMPVDVTSVMYRPLKDLNGIPGAKDLFVCLTGYLRQDREDIMTMVGLMGARFSKPLVANKVTHLVCYKFEGEKYELAKRMGTIKLVNHRWLEDCLKDWVLLPEDKYNKSGFELEIVVEEAKDSEDEAEDSKLGQLGGRNTSKSPPGSKFGTTVTPGLSKTLREEASNAIPDSTGPQVLPNVNIGEDPLTTTRNKNNSDQDADLNNIGDLKAHGFQDLGITGNTSSSAQQPNLQGGTLETKKLSHTRSTSTNADGLAHSDEKLGSASYSRKNQKGFTFSKVSEEYEGIEGNNLETPSTKVEKTRDRIKSACVEGSGKESSVIQEVNGNNLLPQKRTNEAAASSKLKSRKVAGNAKLSIERTPLKNGKSRGLKVPSVVDEPPTSDGFLSVDKDGTNNSNTCLIAKSAASASNSVAINKPISGNAEPAQCNNACLNSAQKAVQSLSKSKTGEPDIKGFEMGQGDNKAEEHNITTNLVFSSPGKKSKNEGFASLDDWDLSNEESDKLVRKSPHKKSSVKRTLGSRPRKGVTAKLKSSVCLNKTMQQDEGVSSSSGSKEIETSGAGQASPPVLDVNKLTEQKAVSEYAEDAGGRTDILDDETEAPDDKCESEMGMAPDEELVHLSKKHDTSTEEKLEAVEPEKKSEEAMPPKKFTNETEKQKPPSLLDPSSKLKVKHQAMKRPASKTKKPTAAKKIAKTVEPVSGEMIPNETRDGAEIKILPHLEEKFEAAEPDKKCEEAASPKKFTNETEKQKSPSLLDSTSKLKVKHQAIKRPTSKTKKLTAAKKIADTVEVASTEMIPNEIRDEAEMKILKEMSVSSDIKRPPSKTKKPTAAKKIAETVEVASAEMIPNETRDEAEMKILKEMSVPSDMKRPASKTKKTTAAKKIAKSVKAVSGDMIPNETKDEAKINIMKEMSVPSDISENSNAPRNKPENFVEEEKENRPNVGEHDLLKERSVVKRTIKSSVKPTSIKSKKMKHSPSISEFNARVKTEDSRFILCGHRLQRKEFQQVIKRLKGRLCRDSHQWSYQATHFIAPEPIRRTEKFFAATASGRWVLKTDFLTASSQAGKFMPEEPYEWHNNGLTGDGAINMEAPRKWRLVKERTGHGAFYGMRIVVYGACFVPPLDTLKRAVKAGDGTILATSPPYTRFLDSGVDYAIVSPGIPQVDLWVQEFLKHEIPCVVADYLVEYVCKPGSPLERHVRYDTEAWADRSLAKLHNKAEEIIEEVIPPKDCNDDDDDDVACQVCGSRERGDVMLICGDESGSVGCGMGTHIDCCNPPLTAVPEEDWFCPECSSTQKYSKNPKKKKKGALSSSKTK